MLVVGDEGVRVGVGGVKPGGLLPGLPPGGVGLGVAVGSGLPPGSVEGPRVGGLGPGSPGGCAAAATGQAMARRSAKKASRRMGRLFLFWVGSVMKVGSPVARPELIRGRSDIHGQNSPKHYKLRCSFGSNDATGIFGLLTGIFGLLTGIFGLLD